MASTPETSESGPDSKWPFGNDGQDIACLASFLTLNLLQQKQQWAFINTTDGQGILDEVILVIRCATHLSEKFEALQSNYKLFRAKLSTMKEEYQKLCNRFSVENREKIDAEK